MEDPMPEQEQARSTSYTNDSKQGKDPQEAPDEEEAEQDDDAAEDVSYKAYRPKKLGFGRPHPDPVVENSTLAAVEPPEITYNLAIPADVIREGKLSDLQLEAVVYGCQRHQFNLPAQPYSSSKDDYEAMTTTSLSPSGSKRKSSPEEKKNEAAAKEEQPDYSYRCGFMLGDGAGMGKGRTLAAFVYENLARGRHKHIWISVSTDLYEDAKRDLKDLGLQDYAQEKCHLLSKLPYTPIKKQLKDGLIFTTYRTLIGSSGRRSRLKQLIDWCGGDEFDGLIMLDECHKAKNILLDSQGNAQNVGSAKCTQTAAAVLELQRCLPRARVVYCSATAVSEPQNLGFMSRLGLWGPGTEHPAGIGQFLSSIKRLVSSEQQEKAIASPIYPIGLITRPPCFCTIILT
jgi:hypothetical protein